MPCVYNVSPRGRLGSRECLRKRNGQSVCIEALTWLSSWVAEVDFALPFWGVGIYHVPHCWLLGLNRDFMEPAYSRWLYRQVMTTASGCWSNVTEAKMGRESVPCARILISMWSVDITILTILSVLRLCIFSQMLSLPFLRNTVICVAGSLLCSNNMCICLNRLCSLHVSSSETFRKVIFTFPRVEGMGIARFSNFPLKEYV